MAWNRMFFVAFLATACIAACEGAMSTGSPAEGATLSYVDTGNPRGLPIVFIHAFPLSQEMWDDQVKVLKGTNRVVTFDMRCSHFFGPLWT